MELMELVFKQLRWLFLIYIDPQKAHTATQLNGVFILSCQFLNQETKLLGQIIDQYNIASM